MAPVLATPGKMTTRGTYLNVAGAGTRTRSDDVVVVIAMVTSPSSNSVMDFLAGDQGPPSAYN